MNLDHMNVDEQAKECKSGDEELTLGSKLKIDNCGFSFRW
jgi:hypothetical protein